MIIYVDIDETICRYEGEREYHLATPVPKNIDKINKMFERGDTIVYWSARGSTTGIDWYELTADQLEEWGCKHTTLLIGKPHFDILIDDKTARIEEL